LSRLTRLPRSATEPLPHAYHREHNRIVVRAQLAGGGHPRHQARHDKDEGGEGKQDRDDEKVGTTTVELHGSALYSRHLVIR